MPPRALRFHPGTGRLDLQGALATPLRLWLDAGPVLRLDVRLEERDRVFGLGAASGDFTRNRARLALLNQDNLLYTIKGTAYATFPWFILERAGQCVGFLLLHAWPGAYRADGHAAMVSLLPDAPQALRLLAVVGNPQAVVAGLARVSGHAQVPPVWALGFHQSRWSYRSAQRVVDVAVRMRQHDVPCDAVHLDIHHMHRFRVFTWDPKTFPDPGGLCRTLGSLGLRAVAIVDPGVTPRRGDPTYYSGRRINAFCSHANGSGPYRGRGWPGAIVFPDFVESTVRDWWASRHRGLFADGVSGVWNDMNDPTLKVGTRYDPLREPIRHRQGSHAAWRNLYANLQAEASVQAFHRNSGERPFVLTRSGFAGIQRHAFVWTGDNYSSWAHLRENLNTVFNLGLSGVPFNGADTGGFASPTWPHPGLKVFKLIKNPELFVRWVQLGALMPFFRVHTALYSFDQEPWSFGRRALTAVRQAIKRRYRILPYLYLMARRAAETGLPLVRPMFFHYPSTDVAAVEDQFLIGPDLMAAPVFEPGQRKRTVSIPPGVWVNYDTGKPYSGPARVSIPTPLVVSPLLVRAGAALPVSIGATTAAAAIRQGAMFEFYPGADIRGEVVIDDGCRLGAPACRVAIAGTRRGESQGGLNFAVDVSGAEVLGDGAGTDPGEQRPDRLYLRLPLAYAQLQAQNQRYDGQLIDGGPEGRSIRWRRFELPLASGQYQAPLTDR